MNTAADLSDLTLNDTEELLTPLNNRSNLGSSGRSGTYTNTFEDSEFHTTTVTEHRSFKPSSYTTRDIISSPQLASTYRKKEYKPKPPDNEKKCIQNTGKVRPSTTKSTNKKINEKLETTQELINPDSKGDLSVWENWLIDKVKLEREEMKKKKEERQLQKRKEEESKREQDDKRKRANEHHKEWCEESLLKAQMQKRSLIRAKKLECEIRKSEQDRKETRSQQEYLLWLDKKNNSLSNQIRKEKEEKARKEKEKKERELKNEEKFEEWLEKIKRRPSSPQKTNQGVITKYPEPSYRNPAPWVGPLSDRLGVNYKRKVNKSEPMRPSSAKVTAKKPITSTPKHGFTTIKPRSDRGVLIMRPLSASTRSR